MDSWGRKQKIMMDKYNQGKLYLYDVYLYTFNNFDRVKVVEDRILQICHSNRMLHSLFYEDNGQVKMFYQPNYAPLFIRDLSDKEEEEKKQSYTSLIYAEQRRKYCPDKNYLLEMYVIKLKEDKYVFVLSLCNQADLISDVERIIKEIFSNRNLITVGQGTNVTQGSSIVSASYWRERLTPPPQKIGPLGKMKEGTYSMESYVFDRDITYVLGILSSKDQDSFKIHVLTIWGYLIAKYFGENNFYVGDSVDGSSLRYIPLKFEKENDLSTNVKNMLQQLAEARQYEGITVTRLEEMMGFDTSGCIPLIQYMTEMQRDNIDLLEMKEGIVYHLLPHKYCDCALNLDYFKLNKELIINYIYNSSVFKDTDIAALHNTFIAMVKNLGHSMVSESIHNATAAKQDKSILNIKNGIDKIIKSEYRDGLTIPDIHHGETRTEGTELYAEKAGILESSGLLHNYAWQDLILIAQKCYIRTFMQDDIILSIASFARSVYVVMEGSVVVNGLDGHNVLSPVQKINEREIFGIESILDKNITRVAYVAGTEYVKLLEVPSNILNTLISKNPNILRALLEIQTDRLYRFERLWVIN